VEVTGKDGRVERLELEATSVFDAGYQALDKFAPLWWWDAAKLITVRRDGAQWRVWPNRLREWKSGQRRSR
jgi:hypothetical protein